MTTNEIHVEKDIMNQEFGYDISGQSNGTYDDVVIADPDGGVASHKKVKLTLNVMDVNHNTKNNLGKFPRYRSKSNYSSQQDISFISDNKRSDDSFVLRVHLTDDQTNSITAWDKYFMLRQMCVNGGNLINFRYRGINCDGSTIVGDRINFKAWIENVRIADEQTERSNSGFLDPGANAFQVSITIVLGTSR